MEVLYSCLDIEIRFFKIISRRKIINDDETTNKAPNKVFNVGTSFQIKYPNIIANIRARYFSGVTKLTSENLYDCDNHKFAIPPRTPIDDSKIKSIKDGIIHCWYKEKKLNIKIENEKKKLINQTGSVEDNFRIAIATYESPKQKIIG